MKEIMSYESPLGILEIGVEDGILCSCMWKSDVDVEKDDISSLKSGKIKDWLDAYFSGADLPQLPEMKFDGSEFSRQVLTELLAVEYGTIISYRDLAERCGRPTAVRAVANAVGNNPIMLFIPCHRIIGSDGKMHGYAGGVERKRWLLKLESHTEEES